jgi:DedD protein
MSLAFWRRKNPAPDATPEPAARTSRTADDDTRDPAAALRARARRRLIGAAALLLAAVIVVPMVLDPEPKPVSDTIPIDIPSEKTKFTPRLAPPPANDAAPAAPAVPPPDSAPKVEAAKPEAAKAPDTAPPAAATAEAQRANAALEGKPEPAPRAEKTDKAEAAKPAKGEKAEKADKVDRAGKFAVQAAATSNLAAARELSDRLKKAGLAPYTERVETAEGTRYRVRVGPYATRGEADKARARLKSLGIDGNVIAP